jgi:hypothetical protein
VSASFRWPQSGPVPDGPGAPKAFSLVEPDTLTGVPILVIDRLHFEDEADNAGRDELRKSY